MTRRTIRRQVGERAVEEKWGAALGGWACQGGGGPADDLLANTRKLSGHMGELLKGHLEQLLQSGKLIVYIRQRVNGPLISLSLKHNTTSF